MGAVAHYGCMEEILVPNCFKLLLINRLAVVGLFKNGFLWGLVGCYGADGIFLVQAKGLVGLIREEELFNLWPDAF